MGWIDSATHRGCQLDRQHCHTQEMGPRRVPNLRCYSMTITSSAPRCPNEPFELSQSESEQAMRTMPCLQRDKQ
ncbi:hypothetical protein CBM2587_A10291 [Cupriavidus taiwanensis]|uniref:Uncharacterized protein n=1 Tax=Cupriavidus taiwanensis TaxID=164546 RepID=A0A975WRL4_9BURK|nr:hypothetical protein CBM2587_A10291 [Cupriavidus taiwanensis]